MSVVCIAIPITSMYLTLRLRVLRKIRRPVGEKMLRLPGASLSVKSEEMWESSLQWMLCIPLVPLTIIGVNSLDGTKPIDAVSAWTIGMLTVTFSAICTAVLIRRMLTLANYSLGLQGERFVAEHLQELSRQGCYVFHDLQPDKTWNIDHIVVTPESVLVIETKTRRKRGDCDCHRATFDGREIQFPWGADRHGLAQAERNAKWVREYLAKAMAEPVKVEAVLTLPGWMIHRKGRGSVYVVNPKEIRALVRARGGHQITPAEQKRMAQIAHALGEKNRDVEF